MVAVIHCARSIRAAFHYNENKVSEGVAVCLNAANYPLEHQDLTHEQKLLMLLKRSTLNQATGRSAVHISLNFDPSEKLPKERLIEIADEYMERIGFGAQPYLVYEHTDSGHPHLHLVTTSIQENGKGIRLHNIGKLKSEPARKAIEQKYGLVKAENHRQSLAQIKPVDTRKLQYGITDTRRAIYNVLASVLKGYRYTSLQELNAVLRLYNVEASRGEPDSRTYQRRGLYYRVLDGEGKPVGVPIKASLFPGRPTLSFLEQRFAVNDALRQPHKMRVRSAIDFILHNPKVTLSGLKKQLAKRAIETVFRQNQDGLLYGVTFVDHQNRCIWNGSDLGKQYSAKALQERCFKPEQAQAQTQAIVGKQGITQSARTTATATQAERQDKGLLDALLTVERGADYLPAHLKKQKKKKKKNISHRL